MTGRTALPGVYVVADPIVAAYAARWALEQRTAGLVPRNVERIQQHEHQHR